MSHFDNTLPACDRRTVTQTDRQTDIFTMSVYRYPRFVYISTPKSYCCKNKETSELTLHPRRDISIHCDLSTCLPMDSRFKKTVKKTSKVQNLGS